MVVARFEKDACIAWRVDFDRGYRDATGESWDVVPLEGTRRGWRLPRFGRRRSIQIEHVVGDTIPTLPEVRLEPISEGKLRVRSTLELVVQRLGEDVPQRVASLVEVRYGAVVRAGPLLFAPLTQEQARSFRAGDLDLPFVGGGLESDSVWESLSGADEALERAAAKSRPSRAPIVVAIAFIIAALCAVATFLLWPRPNPRGVLIAVEGTSDDVRTHLGRLIGERLVAVGLSPVMAEPGLDVSRSPDQILTAMELHRSSAAVLLDVGVQDLRPGLTTGERFYRVRLTAQAVVPGRLEPGESHEIEFASEERSSEDAARNLGVDGLQVISHAILGDLLSSMDVSTIYSSLFSPGSRALERAHRAALDHHSAWQYTSSLRQRSCALAQQDLDAPRDDASRPLTDGCGEAFPIGIAPDGSYAVVQVETVRPYSTFSTASRVVGAQVPDRIELSYTDGRPSKTIAIAHNFYGRGALSDDGSSLFFVERAGIRSGLVKMDVTTGERSVLSVEASPRGFSFPVPSPDGSRVALWRQDEQHGSSEVVILPNNDHCTGLRARHMRWVELPRYEGDEPTTLLALVQDRGDPRGVQLLDATTCEPVADAIVWAFHVDRVVGAWQGKLLVTFRRSCDLGVYDPVSGEMSRRSYPPICFERPVVTRSGYILDAAPISREGDPSTGDTEVVLVDLDAGDISVLTANSLEEALPYASARGSRIVFSQLLDTLYEHVPHMVVATLER